VANEEYRVERRLLTTRVFPTGQGRLDPAPDLPPANVDTVEIWRRWRASSGSGLDHTEVDVVFGLFTDEVQGPPGGPLTFERRPAWVVFDAYTSERWPGHGRSPWQPPDPPGLRYRIEEAWVYDAETGERLTGCRSGTPLA
jgi:hypothetical protein